MWERRGKTAIHDTGFEFGKPGWFAFHAVAIPAAMYVGSMLMKKKQIHYRYR
ncbi:hypothetical protein [Heliorestis convoluta]|uniref:Uncharacterized protein n=1 Tax=Heliorestis convoluta TaxID=356322 RepID=A0A5Q2MYD8_9FIRM|nr:hypothetical protein [Heliorestis convoluta]QGG46961.1 hypothetical protein FTV88_0785 [Heliorestis convoluta]